MNFELNDERQMLQDSLRRFLREKLTPQVREAISESDIGYSTDIWQNLAELGVIGALFTEDQGGFGGSGGDIAVVFEELGRAGAVEPFIDTALLSGGLIAQLGDDEQQSHIEALIGGELQLAFAHTEPANRYENARIETTAKKAGEDYVINGQKAVVVNGAAADYWIVSARTSGDVDSKSGISLFLVPKDADNVKQRSYLTFMGTQASEIEFKDTTVPASALLGEEGKAFEAIEYQSARATAALCAEAVGMMETIKDLTVDYLKTRKQFGQPIGKFQALQHRMADVLIEIEQARSAVVNIAGNLDQPADVRQKHVSAAKYLIGKVSRLVLEESIQMHGGIGMTDEYDLAHMARRLTMVDHRFGDTTYHLERFIAHGVAA